jgi:hypothetical protein
MVAQAQHRSISGRTQALAAHARDHQLKASRSRSLRTRPSSCEPRSKRPSEEHRLVRSSLQWKIDEAQLLPPSVQDYPWSLMEGVRPCATMIVAGDVPDFRAISDFRKPAGSHALPSTPILPQKFSISHLRKTLRGNSEELPKSLSGNIRWDYIVFGA